MAARLATTMFNSLKGRPVQGRIYQGKEPPQFVAIFQPMVVLKGGLSSGYKNCIADKGLNDETYSSDGVALIQISGTSVHNNKAVQVDAVATSLNTYECFLLQSGSSLFTWHGNQSTVEQHNIAAKIAEFLKPGANVKFAKEGTENSTFWFALGGKQSYTSKKLAQEIVRDPHLFAFSFPKGKFEIEEVYNFSQDDLLTEDILILDTHAEVFVWVGQSVDSKEKQNVFEIGQKYVELAASLDGLSPCVPLYRVTEGNEPSFFTTFFSWDPAKANAQGNSFQKKVMLLFGFGGSHAAESQDKSNGNQGGPTQRASALAALNSAFKSSPTAKSSASPKVPSRGSQRAAAVAALSSVLTAEKKGSSDASPVRPSRSPPSEGGSPAVAKSEEPCDGLESNEGSEGGTGTFEPIQETNGEDLAPKSSTTDESECVSVDSQSTFSYEQLRAKSENPVTGIDFKRREAYLSGEEFEGVLGMTKEAFYKIPKWKQDMMKKKVDLF